ncbi:MAG TPA: hypothetical protein VFI39_05095 [Gemmatimonadales bacterium]|nr:hypothetical protein [Gemmatimonadales bacterium]
MDKGTLALLIPILAISIPLAAVIIRGYHTTIRLRIEELKARGGSGEGDAEAIEQLRQEVAEIQERLDFTERLLAQTRESERLGKGNQ